MTVRRGSVSAESRLSQFCSWSAARRQLKPKVQGSTSCREHHHRRGRDLGAELSGLRPHTVGLLHLLRGGCLC